MVLRGDGAGARRRHLVHRRRALALNNTNNIWVDLHTLKGVQATDPTASYLPLIVNRKTVDPRDPDSTPAIQLESAMGAAISSIPGARAVHVAGPGSPR
jgi:UDP-N-acetylglucosamine pyrophosphorylase